ncbi:MAG: single-stranded DNA-binding protein [Candidatus Thorarchaeota archaeon]
MKINQLQADMRNVDIKFRVVKKGEIREIQSGDGKSLKLSEVIVGDDTGKIYLTLWDQSIELLKEGEIGMVKNGFIKVVRNELRLNVGKYGELIKVEKQEEFPKLEEIPESYPKVPSDYKPQFKKRPYKKY